MQFKNNDNYIDLTQSFSNFDEDSSRPPNRFAIFKLLSLATWFDWILITVGSITSIICGALHPIWLLVLVDLGNPFWSEREEASGPTELGTFSEKVIKVGCVVHSLDLVCWMVFEDRQRFQIVKRKLRALLSERIGFLGNISLGNEMKEAQKEFDQNEGNVQKALQGFLWNGSMFLTAAVISLIQGWQLALVLAGVLWLWWKLGKRYENIKEERIRVRETVYHKAGAVAKETLENMKAVFMLGEQRKKKRRYETALEDSASATVKLNQKSYRIQSLIFAPFSVMIVLSVLLGSLFVDHKVTNHFTNAAYTNNNVIAVFLEICMVLISFLVIHSIVFRFLKVKPTIDKVFKLQEKKSLAVGIKGTLFPEIQGEIEFKNVSFTESEKVILDDVNLKIKAQEKVALVGDPESGKAICLDLIERFCDLENQEHGSVLIDGHEIREIDLKCLRGSMGYLGKDPGLFDSKTIKENLLIVKENATSEEIWTALEQINADEFVDALPLKLNTLIGGSALTKGQKQNLAIARMMLKGPKVLLIDEGMMASFYEQEEEVRIIRNALDVVSQGRTTITVVYTLERMMKADRVIMFEKGRVVEEGKHQELVEKQGKYYALQLEAEILKNLVFAGQIEEAKSDESENTKVKSDDITKELSKYVTEEDSRFLSVGSYCFTIIIWIILEAASFVFTSLLSYAIFDYANESLIRKTGAICFLLPIFILGSGFLCSMWLSKISLIGENIVRTCQVRTFEKYLKMPLSWFKHPENTPEALCHKLSDHDPLIMNILRDELFGIHLNCSMIIVIISFFIGTSWRDFMGVIWYMGGISFFNLPLIVIDIVHDSFPNLSEKMYTLPHEMTSNVRTVVSLGIEKELEANYYAKSKKMSMKVIVGLTLVGHSIWIVLYVWYFYFYPDEQKSTNPGYYHLNSMSENKLRSLFCAVFFNFNAFFISYLWIIAPTVTTNANRMKFWDHLKTLSTNSSVNTDESSQEDKKPEIKGKIEFVNVSFKSPYSKKVILQDSSFDIHLPAKIAFVSTREDNKLAILELLQRYYDPDSGDILIDGVNIKMIDVKYLRSCFGMLCTEESALRDGTVKNYIKYGNETATDEEVRVAAEKAGVLDLLENNDEVIIDSKRDQLSKLDKQRIIIARMMLTKTPILVVEEASSSFSEQDEDLLRRSLWNLMEGKTSFIISNKIMTVRNCDEILVFDQGKLVEKGSYDVLKSQQGLLYKLEKASLLT